MKNLAYLFCIILLLCGGCKYFKKQPPKPVDILTTDTTAENDSYDSAAYYNDAATMEPAVQPIAQNNAVAGRYYMIVGCFKVQGNADRYAEKIRGMGYDVQIVPGISNYQMVAARAYNSYRESVNELDKFRNEVTPNAWVYLLK